VISGGWEVAVGVAAGGDPATICKARSANEEMAAGQFDQLLLVALGGRRAG
jgi:hypothetical protein